MAKEVVCVYQDCALCGDKGKAVVEIAQKKGAVIRKVSFVTDEGKNLIFEALTKHNIGTMPFYVCEGRFGTEIEDVLVKRRKINKKKEAKDGVDK